MSAAAAGSGSDVGAAALTSPGSFMNNHSAHMDHDHDDIMGLGAAGDGVMAPPHAFKQQRPSDPAAASPGFGHGHGTLLHCFAPPGDGFDATAQHAHGWAGLGGSGGGFGSCPSPPGSPGLSDGLGSLGSGALAPADSVASHSSSELLGGTAAGSVLPRVGSGGPYGSAAHADCADSGGGRGGCDAPLAAAAGDGGHGSGGGSGGSIGMEHDGVHPGALPPLGVGSPRGSNSHSPGLSAPRAVGSGANSRAQQPPRSAAAAAAATAGGHMATRGGGSGGARAAVRAGAAGDGGHAGQVFRSSYRGVSYDKKKRKWRVQIKVAALGKSGVSVGYFETEDAAARAYDRAALGLLGRAACATILNFPMSDYDNESVPELVGKTREEVKATLKSERAKLPRRRLTNKRRTSRFLGVGSSNRKHQWQARILYHGKVTHLGYYRTEEEAARVYDKVAISLHGAGAQTNFPIDQYKTEAGALQQKLSGLSREELQRALGVKPMDKSSAYRGVSRKKGRWEAKVLLNRKWAYREQFDAEEEAARAYDVAVWRLKPREAANYANFKDTCPEDVTQALAAADRDGTPLPLHTTGLPLTAAPLVDGGLLYDDEGVSIRTPNGMLRCVSIGDLVSLGDSAGQSVSEERSTGAGGSGSGATGSAERPAHSGGAGGGAGNGAGGGGATEGGGSTRMTRASAAGARGAMARSASYTALTGLDGAVTSGLATSAHDHDRAAAAAAPVPLNSLRAFSRGLRSELAAAPAAPSSRGGGGGGMLRVQSVPQLSSYASDSNSPCLMPCTALTGQYSSCDAATAHHHAHQAQQQQQQSLHYHALQQMAPSLPLQQQQQQQSGVKLEGTWWSTELHEQQHSHAMQQQQHYNQPSSHAGLRMSRSCGNLALMSGSNDSPSFLAPQQQQHATLPVQLGIGGSPGLAVASPHGSSLHGTFSSSGYPAADLMASPGTALPSCEPGSLMVRVGSEQHLISAAPGFRGMQRISSEGTLGTLMVPATSPVTTGMGTTAAAAAAAAAACANAPPLHMYTSPEVAATAAAPAASGQQGGSPALQSLHEQQMAAAAAAAAATAAQQHYHQTAAAEQQQYQAMLQHHAASAAAQQAHHAAAQQQMQQQQQQMQQQFEATLQQQQQQQQQQLMLQQQQAQGQHAAAAAAAAAAAGGGRQMRPRREGSGGNLMHRAASCATLESIDERSVLGTRQHSIGATPGGVHHGHSQSFGGVVPAVHDGAAAALGAFGAALGGPGGGGGATTPGGAFAASPHVQIGTFAPPQLPVSASAAAGAGAAAAAEQHHAYGGAFAAAAAQSGYCNSSSRGAGGAGGPAAWAGAGTAEQSAWQHPVACPGSPLGPVQIGGEDLGPVQIGGEDLDEAMAFLTEGSPRRLSEAGTAALDVLGLGPLGGGVGLVGDAPVGTDDVGTLFGGGVGCGGGGAAVGMVE